MTREILCGGAVDLRLGRWQEVLADVASCDAVICDPPYSARTHEGALSTTGVAGVEGYDCWMESDARRFLDFASRLAASWIVVHTDDVLAPVLREHAEELGRYAFPMVPVLQHQPRVSGDGPGCYGHALSVSRPRERRFLSWGSLPGWYEAPRDGSIVRGGKPLGLMRAIVRDYTRPGDLVVDPFCGGGTTALACAIEGRRCITSEMDPVTFEKARERLAKGFTPDMLTASGVEQRASQDALFPVTR